MKLNYTKNSSCAIILDFNLLFIVLLQQLGNFKAEINKSKVASKHWRRERGNLKFEDVPGIAPEDLELVELVKQFLQQFFLNN